MSEKQVNPNAQETSSSKDKEFEITSSDFVNEDQNKQSDENNNFDRLVLGEYLKSLRQENNISVKQLSIDTKINESVLQNLEAQAFDQLPRKIYLQGFIKTYCQYFKQDPVHAIELLEKVFLQESPVTDVHGRFENHQGTKINQKTLTKVIASLIFLVIFIVVIKKLFFTKRLEVINSEITTEKINSSTPLVGSPSNIELSQESIEVKEDKISKTKTIEQETLELEITKKNNKQKESQTSDTSQEEGDQLPTEISFKKFPENFLVYENTQLEEIKEFVPSNILSPPTDASEKIIISAQNDKTWIAYQKDDEDIKQLILKEGKVLVISGDEIRIIIGNSNSIRLVHNLREVDIKSKTGIKSLVFPKSAASQYRLPLFYQDSEGNYVSSGKN